MGRIIEIELPIEKQNGQLGGVMRGATRDPQQAAETLQVFVNRQRAAKTNGKAEGKK